MYACECHNKTAHPSHLVAIVREGLLCSNAYIVVWCQVLTLPWFYREPPREARQQRKLHHRPRLAQPGWISTLSDILHTVSKWFSNQMFHPEEILILFSTVWWSIQWSINETTYFKILIFMRLNASGQSVWYLFCKHSPRTCFSLMQVVEEESSSEEEVSIICIASCLSLILLASTDPHSNVLIKLYCWRLRVSCFMLQELLDCHQGSYNGNSASLHYCILFLSWKCASQPPERLPLQAFWQGVANIDLHLLSGQLNDSLCSAGIANGRTTYWHYWDKKNKSLVF